MLLSSLKKSIKSLPDNPGVYVFKGKSGEVLYVGKATNLKSRVRSYFSGADELGARIASMVAQIEKVEFTEADSVLEALILESNLIKEHQPKYNVKEKDDKSFSYFVITKEEFPRVLILRKTEIDKSQKAIPSIRDKRQKYNSKVKSNNKIKFSNFYGPYTSKKQMEIALKIIRKIFPFHSLAQKTEKGCLDFQLGRCPGPYVGSIARADYLKNIRGIKMILEGKKKSLIAKMEKEMRSYSEIHEFEKAAEARNKIFALRHIRDVALISSEDGINKIQNSKFKNLRIEAYDISSISGKYAVGSMVVFSNGEPDKAQYRKFKIKTVAGADDVGMMREILLRRFQNDLMHPDLILLDGGAGHLNMAEKVLKSLGLSLPLAAIAKGSERKNLDLRFTIYDLKKDIKNILEDKKLLKRIMDEAHRFAIGYHRKLRKKSLLD